MLLKRLDHNDLIFQNERGKITAIIRKVKEVHEKGQPILIGTASIDKNELLGAELTKAGIVHEMLNAKNHEREGEIIADAGTKGKVTLATNMAGRGVDIKLGGIHATQEEAEEIKALGGLFVLGTERHEARRIDNQLRGRAGRQGDPGETQFYVSMDDALMRVFASDTVKNMMGRFGIPEDQPIENSVITHSLESAQKKIEGFHFDSRKHVLAYDNVLNQQRMIIYARRIKLLLGTVDEVKELAHEVVAFVPEIEVDIQKRIAEYGEEVWYQVMRKLMLQVNDVLWVEHLEVMQHTRSSVGLRAYGQQDPLIEYRKEAVRLFKEMQEAAYHRIAELIPTVRIEAVEKEEEELKKAQAHIALAGGSSEIQRVKEELSHTPVRKEEKFGRNEYVTITNGTDTETMKFKKAETLIASGDWSVVEKN
jgi:preprotein translocase subunit SecA